MANSISSIEVSSPYTTNSCNYGNLEILQIAYFQKIKKNWSWGLRASFYDPWIEIKFKENPAFIDAVGSTEGTIFNLTILTEYKYSLLRRISINFYIGINNSYYLKYDGLEINLDIDTRKFQYTDENKGFKGFQIRPEIAVGIEWQFLKYFSLETKIAYIQGTRRIQELEAWYSFNGGEEFYGKNYSNGSMWGPSIGLSFYFGGYPNKKRDKKYNKIIFPNQRKRKVFK